MTSSAKPPPLMTDPLSMSAHGEVDDPAVKEEQDEIDRQQQAMDRGKPPRNLKKIGVVTIGLLAAGYMIYPSLSPANKVPANTLTQTKVQTDRSAAGTIVEQLKNQQPPAKPTPDLEVTAVKKDTPPGPQQGLAGSQAGDRPMTAGELQASRQETIVASGMEPSDFAIPQREGERNRGLKPIANDSQGAVARMMAEQKGIYEKAMLAATAQPPEREQGPRRSMEDEFVLRTRNSNLEEPTRLSQARAKASLYQGTIIEVILDRAINTDHPGVARGRVRSDVYDSVNQEILLIPRGSVIILPYLNSVLVGQARILVAGERLIFPNGKSVSLSGTVASDMQGASGLPAEIDNHFYEMFKTSFILGAASLLLPKDQRQISISDTASGSTKTGGSILATTLYDTIQKITERNATIKPTATTDVGEPFTLMLSKDMELEPYRGRK